MKQNPWLGLASYDEQAVAQGYKFCGRERAIKELYSIIDNNIFTTLYGKSGIGKSSLLQAGVFPRLRGSNYLPVMIRLGAASVASDYTDVIINVIQEEANRAGAQCISKGVARTGSTEERLWHFFHSTTLCNSNGEVLFPVIVLDQFEELYYRDKQALSALMKALYLLVDDSSLSINDEDEAINYRIVLSIREDDLFHLEDSIDKLRLTELKYNRYRLNEFSDEEARDVILLPGRDLFYQFEANSIADNIIREAKSGSEDISTAVLSLICSRVYYMCQSVDNSATKHITLLQVNSFFRQAEGNFLKSFYDDIIKELSSPAKWYYIEDTLVTDEGRRNSVLKSEFDKHVPDGAFLFKGEKSMLRCITTSGTDEPRVEIIHDMLARQMLGSRNERKLQQQAATLRKQRITAIAIILFFLVLGVLFYGQYRSIVAERNSMLRMQSHYIAEKAEKLLDEYKSILAARLLLAVLPEDLNKPNRPHVSDVEAVLRIIDSSPRFYHLVRVMKHDGDVNSASFSPDGKYIVTASTDKTAKIWDAQTGEQVGETMYHDYGVYSASFSPDGKYIVTASSDKTAKIWDAQTGKQVGETMKHDDSVNSASFSLDGKYIVTASYDGTAKIWDAQTGKQVGEAIKHDGSVYSASFSPDGKYIVTTSRNNAAKIWDVQTGQQVGETMKHELGLFVSSASFSPDGKYIVTTSWDKTAKIWDVQTGQQVGETMRHDDWVNSASFSPDGKYIVTASRDWSIKIWDAQKRKVMKHDGDVNSASFSLDGKYIVTASSDKTAKIWDAQTGEQVGETMYHDDAVTSSSFSPDGKYIVTASSDKTAKIWDAQTGKQVGEAIKHDGSVYSASFSPDGKYIVTASSDKTAKIWDAQTGKQVGEAIKHDGRVYSASFSPDGKYIVTASWDETAKIWDAQTGKQVGEAIKHDDSVYSASFSPDGKYIVTTSLDNTAKIWDAQTGKQVGEAIKHDGSVNSASFSPDGKYIVTTSWYKTAKIWDAQTGKQVGETMKHDDSVNSASFSLDGKYIVTASYDGTAKITEFRPYHELVNKYRKLFQYLPLTEEELIEYNFK